jgi:hypothetical protein
MNRNEKILIWLMRLGGAVMLTALGAVVMLFDWMSMIHQELGLGELPRVPIVGYLTRSVSALCALHGTSPDPGKTARGLHVQAPAWSLGILANRQGLETAL